MTERPSTSQPSLLRRLKWSMLGFGLAMGVIFPVYASFFVVWKPGMFWFFAIGCLIAGAIVGIANNWMTNSVLVKALESISEVAGSLREGNLRTSTGIRSDDKIGRIASDLDGSIRELSGSIGSLDRSTRAVESVVEGIVASQAHIESGLADISRSARDLTDSAVRELDLIQDSSRGIHDLSESIQKLATDLSRASSEMSSLASRSRAQRDDSSGNSDLIASLVERMRSFRESVERIEASNGLIARIVKQTEVLSLNASIEATRAGEHGRGFSVVAQEIRTLAHDSASTGSRIAEEIVSMRTRLSEAEGRLGELRGGMEGSASTAASIADSATLQERGLEEWSRGSESTAATAIRIMTSISVASDSIRNLVGEIRKMDESSRRAGEVLSGLGGDVGGLSREVDVLRSLVAKFRT